MSDENLIQNTSFKKYVEESIVDHCLSIIKINANDRTISTKSKDSFTTNKEKLWESLGELFFIFLVFPPSQGPNKETKKEFEKVLKALEQLTSLLKKQSFAYSRKKEDFYSPARELASIIILFQSQQDNPLLSDVKRITTYYNDIEELIRLLDCQISLYRRVKSFLNSKIPGRGKNKELNDRRKKFMFYVLDIYQDVTGEPPKSTMGDRGNLKRTLNQKRDRIPNDQDSKAIQLLGYLLSRVPFMEDDVSPSAMSLKEVIKDYLHER